VEDVAAFVATARGAAPFTGDRPGDVNAGRSLVVRPLSFHAIAPLPDSYSEHPYSDHGYDLECAHWGVKWGACNCAEPVLVLDGRGVVYAFECAWGPPVKTLTRASKRYPTLRFWLSWGGEGPCRGRHTFSQGEVTSEIEDDYDRSIALDLPTDKEWAADEDLAQAKYNAAEQKYIVTHDAWVEATLGK
jgi:hypothetical protein